MWGGGVTCAAQIDGFRCRSKHPRLAANPMAFQERDDSASFIHPY